MGTSTARIAGLRKRRRRAELPAQLGMNDEERRFLVARGYLDPLETAKTGAALDSAVQQFFSDQIAEITARR
jgi:hypothetical protein